MISEMVSDEIRELYNKGSKHEFLICERCHQECTGTWKGICYEKDYDDWVQRYLARERKAPGYLGTTIIIPGGASSNVRYIIRRFTDKTSMQVWDNSQESKKLLEEANSYSTRHYETTTGLETWFAIPDLESAVAPPRWKMVIVVFIAAYAISLLSRSILNPSIGHWPLLAHGIIFTAILTIGLTYFALPILNRLLRRWLYPTSSIADSESKKNVL